MACVASAWRAIRRHLARRCIVNPGSWCSTLTCIRSSGWSQRFSRPPPYWLLVARTFSKSVVCCWHRCPLPRLDSGDGVPEAASHQTLIHEVLSGLLRPDCHAPALFSNERWNLIRCTAQHWVWQQLLSTHGLLTSSEATGLIDRQTVPIVELVELDHCPEMPLSCLRSLVLGMAPALIYIQQTSGWNRQTVAHSRGTLFCSVLKE